MLLAMTLKQMTDRSPVGVEFQVQGGKSPESRHGRARPAREEGRGAPPRGFSIVEVLAAIALAGVLLGLSLPSFSGFLNSYRVEAAARVVWSDIQCAKMSAIKANQSVSVALTGPSAYSYSYTDGLSVNRTFSRDLSGNYPGVTVSFNGPTTLTFNSMGMKQPPTPGTSTTVTVSGSAKSMSFSVSWTGAVGSL